MVSKAGAFFTYRTSNNLFYTAVSGLGKVAVQALMGKGASFCALFTEGRYLLVNMDGSYSTIIAEDVVPAGAFFRHRVFVGMKNGVLKYSAPEDFTNFDESVEDGGSIRLTNGGGEIIAVKVFDDALYVFFESGIMRLTIGGDPCEFYVEKIDYAGGDIFSRTICVCDHAIYFMSQGGVYCLKGKRAERAHKSLQFKIFVVNLRTNCAQAPFDNQR